MAKQTGKKALRRERARAASAAESRTGGDPPGTRGSSPRKLRLPLVGLGVLLLAALFAWTRGHGDAPVDVPAPDMSAMLRPVRERIEAARAAVLAEPDAAARWGRLGAVFDAHSLYVEAIECYRAALSIAPREFRYVYSLAVVSDFQGSEPQEIVALFERALGLQPSYPPAYHRYGDALARLGRVEEARTAYARAVDLDGDFAMARRSLGLMLLDLGQTEQAIEHLERSAELEPDDAITFNGLARAFRLAGDEERARAAADAAASKQPIFGVPDPVRFEVDNLAINPQACDRRAREFASQGRHREALAELELLAEMTPGEAGVRHRLGVTHLRLGEFDRAVSVLREAVRLDPERAESHLQLGAILADLSRTDEAIESYRKAVALHDQAAGLHKQLALLLGKNGQIDEAIDSFRRALLVGPPDAEVLHNLGTALDRRGDRAEACVQFEAALLIDPENPHTHFNLGLSLEALERIDEAVEHYRAAVRADPGHAAAARLAELTGSSAG